MPLQQMSVTDNHAELDKFGEQDGEYVSEAMKMSMALGLMRGIEKAFGAVQALLPAR